MGTLLPSEEVAKRRGARYLAGEAGRYVCNGSKDNCSVIKKAVDKWNSAVANLPKQLGVPGN